MVEYHTAEGVIDPVIQIVARLTPTDGFANDFRYRCRGGSNEEPTWLGKDFERLGKKSTDLGVDRCRQPSEGRHGVVIVCGKAATNVEQLEVEPAQLGLGEDAGGEV